MKLEHRIIHVKGIQFADETRIDNGTVMVNPRSLREVLEQDKRFSSVDIQLATPGEDCRILRVHDVIEPRAKARGSVGEDFPGVLGKQVQAGMGSTWVLHGAAVAVCDCGRILQPGYDPNGEIIDMSGPAADIGIYGKTHNLVLLPKPADGISPYDYKTALKIAGLKAAVYLARAAEGLNPDEVQTFALPPLAMNNDSSRNLPRIGYIFQIFSMQYETVGAEPVFYGGGVEGLVPTIVHPNEVLDGAVLNPNRSPLLETYVIQNHPIIKGLYRRHGEELVFAGVIMTTAHNNPAEYERTANVAAKLAKWVLGADGVVITKAGGGAPEVAMSQMALQCEKLNVKTAIALVHMTSDASDTASASNVMFNSRELDAIVSMGDIWKTPLNLPRMGKILGVPYDAEGAPPVTGEHIRTLRFIKGIFSPMGISRMTSARY